MNTISSERSATAAPPFGGLQYLSTPSTMSDTVTRVIPRTNGTSVLTIDEQEWDPVIDVVQSEFGGTLAVHRHGVGAFHGRDFVPLPHYLLELTADDEEIPRIKDRIDPLIEAIIARNRTPVSAPAES